MTNIPTTYLLFVLLLITISSCHNSSNKEIEQSDEGYTFIKNHDTIRVDGDLKINSYSTLLDDSIVTVAHFENFQISIIEHRTKENIYSIGYDKVGKSPSYLQLSKGLNSYDSMGTVIQYTRDGKKESLDIKFSFLFEDGVTGLWTSQLLQFNNDKIDTLASSFHTASKKDSCSVLQLFNKLKPSERYYYQLITYTDFFNELNPKYISGELYVGDTSRNKTISYFKKGVNPNTIYCSEKRKPKVYQLYIFESGTNKPLYYRIGVIRDEYLTLKEMKLAKKQMTQEYDFIQKIQFRKKILDKLQSFDLVDVGDKDKISLNRNKFNNLVE